MSTSEVRRRFTSSLAGGQGQRSNCDGQDRAGFRHLEIPGLRTPHATANIHNGETYDTYSQLHQHSMSRIDVYCNPSLNTAPIRLWHEPMHIGSPTRHAPARDVCASARIFESCRVVLGLCVLVPSGYGRFVPLLKLKGPHVFVAIR